MQPSLLPSPDPVGDPGLLPQSQTHARSQGGGEDLLTSSGRAHPWGPGPRWARRVRGPCLLPARQPAPPPGSASRPTLTSPSPTAQSCLTPPAGPASVPQPPCLEAGPAPEAWHFLAVPTSCPSPGRQASSVPYFSRCGLWALCIQNTVLLENAGSKARFSSPPFLTDRVTCNHLPRK